MNFEELFKSSNYQPIEYKGRKIQYGEAIPENKEYQITFESTNSNWEQGIFIRCDGTHFQINSQIEKLNTFWLWESENPKTNIVRILKKGKGELKVWNIWRINKGPMSYGHNGAALYTTDLANGKRFFCNDGHPDDDFDDIIFTITWGK